MAAAQSVLPEVPARKTVVPRDFLVGLLGLRELSLLGKREDSFLPVTTLPRETLRAHVVALGAELLLAARS